MDTDRYITKVIKHYYKDARIVSLEQRTEGAACTVRAAGAYLHPLESVVVANCDQYVEFIETHGYNAREWLEDYEAGMLVFNEPTRNPKWSFAAFDDNGNVERVAEKDPISDVATVGVYYWSEARMMFSSIGEMMVEDDRTNGEFYLCPSFNYLINEGHTVGAYCIDKMWGLGTPEDLKEYLCRGD